MHQHPVGPPLLHQHPVERLLYQHPVERPLWCINIPLDHPCCISMPLSVCCINIPLSVPPGASTSRWTPPSFYLLHQYPVGPQRQPMIDQDHLRRHAGRGVVVVREITRLAVRLRAWFPGHGCQQCLSWLNSTVVALAEMICGSND